MDDVLINKAATIERCIKRIKEEYSSLKKDLSSDISKQEAIILNIQRACESAIDMGTHVIRIKSLGVPQSSREIFAVLENANLISHELSQKMQAMVGFRNIAIHNYTMLNLDIVRSIIENNLDDFLNLSKSLLQEA